MQGSQILRIMEKLEEKRENTKFSGKGKLRRKKTPGGHIGKAQPHHHVDIEPKLKAKT